MIKGLKIFQYDNDGELEDLLLDENRNEIDDDEDFERYKDEVEKLETFLLGRDIELDEFQEAFGHKT